MGTTPDSDVAFIDGLVAAFFAAFDNRDGRVPDAAAFTALFTAAATITHRHGLTIRSSSPTDFFTPRLAMLTDGRLLDFHEWEVEAVTSVHNGIATRTSFYRKAGRDYGGTGTKLFQFARQTAPDWRITSVLWEDDA